MSSADGRVEVAGGLVGQDQVRVGDQGPGHRHPLLLATGELAGTVVDPVGQAHPVQGDRARSCALGPVDAGVDQGQLDVAAGRRATAGG